MEHYRNACLNKVNEKFDEMKKVAADIKGEWDENIEKRIDQLNCLYERNVKMSAIEQCSVDDWADKIEELEYLYSTLNSMSDATVAQVQLPRHEYYKKYNSTEEIDSELHSKKSQVSSDMKEPTCGSFMHIKLTLISFICMKLIVPASLLIG